MTRQKLGERLRELRRGLGWTQDDLAHELDVSQALVSLWESGAHAPSWDNLNGLAVVLETPLSVLTED